MTNESLTVLTVGGLYAGLCLPAYLWALTRRRESLWFPFAAFPAVVVWALVATVVGFDFGNLWEVIILLGIGVALGYGKAFLVDAGRTDGRGTTYKMMGLLMLAAVGMRLTLPMWH